MHRLLLLTAVAGGFLYGVPARAEITWQIMNAASIPATKLQLITQAMNSGVHDYNTYAIYTITIPVFYDPDPNVTANAVYNSRIKFGTKINDWTAMHEIAHVLGVGTYSAWSGFRSGSNTWLGAAAIAELKAINGPGAVLHADAQHFWPYGLNTSDENRRAHVRLVGALRQDMRLPNNSFTGLPGDFNNNGVVDAADYTVYRDNLAAGIPVFNGYLAGTISVRDYAVWKANFGATLASGASALSVPEPSSALPGLLAILALLPARVRGKS